MKGENHTYDHGVVIEVKFVINNETAKHKYIYNLNIYYNLSAYKQELEAPCLAVHVLCLYLGNVLPFALSNMLVWYVI